MINSGCIVQANGIKGRITFEKKKAIHMCTLNKRFDFIARIGFAMGTITLAA